MITYSDVPFEFDITQLQIDMIEFYEKSGKTIHQLDRELGQQMFVTYMYDTKSIPTARNLVELANFMGVNPRKYFVLKR